MAKVLNNMSDSGETNSIYFRDFCKKIIFAANNMNEIIIDFLDFQAIEDGKIELSVDLINLNDIARKFVESNTVLADSKDIKLILECHDSLPPVNADSKRIGQVMENMISNAVKYCPFGSNVFIKTRANKNKVLFEVVDNGPGLSGSDMKKVFNRYFRLENQPIGVDRGSGLGLTICKMLIDLHGGNIGVRNNTDAGATFWFSLNI
jgi:two-component system sensor histidine kinase ResE